VKIGVIVEGHGEEAALPILVKRLAGWIAPDLHVEVIRPFRLSRGSFAKQEEFARAVEFVARKAGPGGPILIVLDSDDDPACQLGPALLAQARRTRGDRDTAAVLAVREYEAWFLAGARSLAGKRGLPADLQPPPDPEQGRSPKAWVGAQMPSGYSETLDQPALTAELDLAAARSAPSFDKLVRDVARLLGRAPPPRVA
jgi:hypothetical protein